MATAADDIAKPDDDANLTTASTTANANQTLTLLSLPPELLVYLAGHLHSSQDYLSLSSTSRQLRRCCHSLQPRALRVLMERTLAQDLEAVVAEQYVASLQSCKFCKWYFADEENRQKYRETNPTRRYNLILSHETKHVCGGCLTLSLALKYCWYPWFACEGAQELRGSYLAAIQARVADTEGYSHI
ncbi:hypothetical protein FN846DRAFT_181833 [Sphaerosporella brunnea]|uniref:F-box domain-containing protein n=1 Tax=Sphaerosporella brunnea TaxID=1250544 RepID=A0A5J5F800_9PEZI|nr:hypothetical protein FN846DRAFT_181833 [Sphaerosporella brunnea]